MNNNGHRPQDPKGDEGGQEGPQGFHLQQSPSATAGDYDGEKGWKLIHLENASQGRTLRIQADTQAEVMAAIFREVPSLFDSKLQIKLFSKPVGAVGRVPIETVFNLFEIWATVYLHKH